MHARRTSCGTTVVQSGPSMRWRMTEARSVVCWRWYSEPLRPYLTKYNSEVLLISQNVLILQNYVIKLILKKRFVQVQPCFSYFKCFSVVLLRIPETIVFNFAFIMCKISESPSFWPQHCRYHDLDMDVRPWGSCCSWTCGRLQIECRSSSDMWEIQAPTSSGIPLSLTPGLALCGRPLPRDNVYNWMSGAACRHTTFISLLLTCKTELDCTSADWRRVEGC